MAASDDFAQFAAGLDAPASHAVAVSPDDSNDLANVSRYLYVGGAGDVKVVTVGSDTVVFKAVPVGATLRVRATRIFATGTTATLIVALR